MNDNEMHRATAREWLWARIVLIGGAVIAVVVVAAIAFWPAPAPIIAPPTQQTQADRDKKDAMLVCAQELINAKNSTYVPGAAQLVTMYPSETKVRARYTCTAATSAARYVIAADLICRDMMNSRCVRLYDITLANGGLLYRRQQN